MKKSKLEILERAFMAEIDGAMGKGIGLLQTKSKLARELADEGYLVSYTLTSEGRFPTSISGYILTEIGHMTYCTSEFCSREF